MILSTPQMLFAIISMAIITYLLRAFPTIVPKFILESPILKSFNYILPMSVMMVLILASLNIDPHAFNIVEIAAKALALLMVLISYAWLRNVLVSIIVGVGSVNGFLWIFHSFMLF